MPILCLHTLMLVLRQGIHRELQRNLPINRNIPRFISIQRALQRMRHGHVTWGVVKYGVTNVDVALDHSDLAYCISIYTEACLLLKNVSVCVDVQVRRMFDIYQGFVAESIKLKMGSTLRCEDLTDALAWSPGVVLDLEFCTDFCIPSQA